MTPTAGHVLALVGPTAAGKSELALEIARRRSDLEIVAIDAFTLYRGMDVGTAKPAAQARTEIPHHLIDVLDPWEEATVQWFQALARAAIDDVLGRGRTPLLVGGSGLYFRAVVDDLRFPPTDARVRRRLTEHYAGRPQAAHERLHQLDAAAAARMDPHNLRRAVRALEVIELTGAPFSSFGTAWGTYESVYRRLEARWLDEPDLAGRIDERTRTMVDGGLLEEARILRRGPGLSRTARQAIGYAEALDVLGGRLPPDDLIPAIVSRSRRYARRQRAWFRRDPRVQPSSPGEVLAAFTSDVPSR